MIPTLPILVALSWVPTTQLTAHTIAPAPAPQRAGDSAAAAATIQCPLTGREIPSCCCPVKQ